MRTIGIDLAVTHAHYAVVVDDSGQYVGPVFRFETDPADLAELVQRARAGVADDEPLRVIMEPTGLGWFPVASYFSQRSVTVYLVNSQRVADLRKHYRKYAKSDRISARVLVRLPWSDPDALHPLHLASADQMSGQRWCKQREELAQLITAIQNRVQAWERACWPGLEQAVGDLFAPWLQVWRAEWYDPWRLLQVETRHLATVLSAAGADPLAAEALAGKLQEVARRAVALFGTPDGQPSPYLDYAALQDQVLRELRLLASYQAEQQAVQHQVRPLYRRLHPSRALESVRGVGQDGAAVYCFFVGDVERFTGQKAFRGWSGLVPASDQSGGAEKKGLSITAAGPDLIKKYAYLDADVARQWDPQLAALYYDQMVHKGKHHIQAVCCCATHLLDRVRVVLREGRPYQLRDVDGQPITWQEGRAIVLERYQVPEEVRQRSRQRTRRARRDQRAERQQKRRSSPVQ